MKNPTKAQLITQLETASVDVAKLQASLDEALGKKPANDFMYWQYHISVTVLEDHYTPNSVGWPNLMTRVDLTDDELTAFGMARFANYQQKALDFDPERPHRSVVDRMRLCRLETKRLGRRPWCLGWFAHSTYRDGRTNEELFSSFGKYVQEYSWMQDLSSTNVEKHYGVPYVCLMGAQDRYRWKLCEYEKCQLGDIVTITH